MRTSCERLRVTAQLIEVSSKCHSWSERYPRKLTDVISTQVEISRMIVDALQVGLQETEPILYPVRTITIGKDP